MWDGGRGFHWPTYLFAHGCAGLGLFITGFMVDRYGDFVLYRPPVQGNTLALWVMPIAILLVGALGVTFTVRNRSRKLAAAQNKENN